MYMCEMTCNMYMHVHVHVALVQFAKGASAECSEGVGLRAAGGFQLQVAQSHTRNEKLTLLRSLCCGRAQLSWQEEWRESNGRLNLDAAFRFQGWTQRTPPTA